MLDLVDHGIDRLLRSRLLSRYGKVLSENVCSNDLRNFGLKKGLDQSRCCTANESQTITDSFRGLPVSRVQIHDARIHPLVGGAPAWGAATRSAADRPKQIELFLPTAEGVGCSHKADNAIQDRDLTTPNSDNYLLGGAHFARCGTMIPSIHIPASAPSLHNNEEAELFGGFDGSYVSWWSPARP